MPYHVNKQHHFSDRKSCESGDIILSTCHVTNVMSGNSDEPLMSLLQVNKFGDHSHCDMGNLIILICHVTSCDHVFKGLCNLMGRSPS